MNTRWLGIALLVLLAGCGLPNDRFLSEPRGEAWACGRALNVPFRIVHWEHPAGLNAYTNAGTGHFGQRGDRFTASQRQRLHDQGWTLDALRDYIELVVIHYDAVGDSRACFDVLRKRGLSCHFLIDTDGTIYQTLDLREKAWHATIANDRSIGIELAHHGASEIGSSAAQPGDIVGVVQGKMLRQPPFAEAQYAALAKLLAGLADAFPKIALDYPHDANGEPIAHKLPDAELAAFRGILGHYHVQTNKVDPGPAFDWSRVMREAQIQRRAR